MTRTRTILTLAFVLVFAAGAVVGMVRHRVAIGDHPPDRGSFLTKELGLTSDQQQQMKQIWSEMGPGRGPDHNDRRREYQKQRDDAIKALLNEEQKAKYEGIQKEYADRVAEMGKERQAAFQQAVEKTKAILTPEQAVKYETFLNKRRNDGGGPGGPGGPGNGPPWRDHRGDGPSTRHAD